MMKVALQNKYKVPVWGKCHAAAAPSKQLTVLTCFKIVMFLEGGKPAKPAFAQEMNSRPSQISFLAQPMCLDNLVLPAHRLNCVLFKALFALELMRFLGRGWVQVWAEIGRSTKLPRGLESTGTLPSASQAAAAYHSFHCLWIGGWEIYKHREKHGLTGGLKAGHLFS